MLQSLALIGDHRRAESRLRLFVPQSPMTLAAPGQAEWLEAEMPPTTPRFSSLVIELRLEDVALQCGRRAPVLASDWPPTACSSA